MRNTTNQTGGLSSEQNIARAPSPVPFGLALVYSPERHVAGGNGKDEALFPAFFTGASIKIISKNELPASNYVVEMLGTSFVPSVDNTTNIVYGAAGSVFVTISFFNLQPYAG
jgi:hypothetical protein